MQDGVVEDDDAWMFERAAVDVRMQAVVAQVIEREIAPVGAKFDGAVQA
jgi:hypothetical protein